MAKLKTDFTKEQLTPSADIGEKRNEMLVKMGTFKNVSSINPSGHFNATEPDCKIDKFYETFAGRERQ